MGKDYKIALFLEKSRYYGRELVKGVVEYSRSFGPWSFYFEDQFYSGDKRKAAIPFLKKWGVDGVVARDFKGMQPLIELGVPVISALNSGDLNAVVQIETDDKVIGRLACEHFSDKGFKNLAYCGFSNMPWSGKRQTGFIDAALSLNSNTEIFNSRSSARMLRRDVEYRNIAKWLGSLAKPVGVFCCNDDRGYDVIESCKIAKLEVPYEVAILGVDNDPNVCDLSNPPLSSISLGIKKGGFEAAETLERLIKGEPVPSSEIIIKPLGVVVRHSTDFFAIEDEEVAKAVSFIFNKLPANISVDDVAEATNLSRRALEVRFRKSINHTIADETRRIRINNSKKLLRETDFSVARIAVMTGFSSTPYFSATFSKMTGLSPLSYRKSCRNS